MCFGFYSIVQQSCEDTTLDNIILAAQQRDPHHIMSDLISLRQDDGTFIISNKSSYSQCRFGINQGTSLLRAKLKPARVLYNTLSAEMTLNGTHWIIDVRGEVESCPGKCMFFSYFTVQIIISPTHNILSGYIEITPSVDPLYNIVSSTPPKTLN